MSATAMPPYAAASCRNPLGCPAFELQTHDRQGYVDTKQLFSAKVSADWNMSQWLRHGFLQVCTTGEPMVLHDKLAELQYYLKDGSQSADETAICTRLKPTEAGKLCWV